MIGQALTFPEVLANVATAELVDVYEAGPARIRQSLVGLGSVQLRAHPRTDKWSIGEVVLHLTDSEIMGAGRIRLALAQPGVPVAGYDQDIWANELRYDRRDHAATATALQLFSALRDATTSLFREASRADWDNTVLHSEWGPLTLRQLLELYADHSERHIEQILHMRQLLGNSTEIPMLLTTRLY
jgi:hypothetical protein